MRSKSIVRLVQFLRHVSRQPLQHLAPDRVAVAVVPVLEVVSVDDERRERLASAASAVPGAPENLLEAAPVGQAGQGVRARLKGEFSLHGGAASKLASEQERQEHGQVAQREDDGAEDGGLCASRPRSRRSRG